MIHVHQNHSHKTELKFYLKKFEKKHDKKFQFLVKLYLLNGEAKGENLNYSEGEKCDC